MEMGMEALELEENPKHLRENGNGRGRAIEGHSNKGRRRTRLNKEKLVD